MGEGGFVKQVPLQNPGRRSETAAEPEGTGREGAVSSGALTLGPVQKQSG